MPKPLSFDLRSRVLAAVEAGLSCRQAGERFGVSASSAIRWAALRRSEGRRLFSVDMSSNPSLAIMKGQAYPG